MMLAHGDLSLAEKSFALGDVFLGRRPLADHTVAALARYGQINPAHIHAALSRMSMRDAILAGDLPLIPPPSLITQAERRLARLVRELGRRRVAELLFRPAGGSLINAANNNAPAGSTAA
jgi:hypothetical protein